MLLFEPFPPILRLKAGRCQGSTFKYIWLRIEYRNTSAGSEKEYRPFLLSEIWYWAQNGITDAAVHSPALCDYCTGWSALSQSPGVRQRPPLLARPLRYAPHCINSRNSTPKAWKRHTPLSLLQDPENPQIPDQEPQREKSSLEQMHFFSPLKYIV